MTLEIKTADELTDPELEARWAARRAARQTNVLQQILRAFVDRGGPIPVDAIMAALSGGPPEALRETLITGRGRPDSDPARPRRDRLPLLGHSDALRRATG